MLLILNLVAVVHLVINLGKNRITIIENKIK